MGLMGGVALQVMIVMLSTQAPVDYCGWPGCFETSQGRIQVGDERDKVIQTLADAWYHGICDLSEDYATDVFLYGPRRREHVYLLILRSEGADSRLIVQKIGRVESSLAYEYHDCLPQELWDNSLEKPSIYLAVAGLFLLVTHSLWMRGILNVLPALSERIVSSILFLSSTFMMGAGLISLLMIKVGN